MGGCCCCCEDKTTSDAPEGYEKNRSCTDIIFLILFLLAWAAFLALGVITLGRGDIQMILRGRDYLGYYCGGDEAPRGFSDFIPEDAPFQSKVWSENTFVWYPLPLRRGNAVWSSLFTFNVLGVCVKTCPKANLEALAELLKPSSDGDKAKLARIQVHPYGNVSIGGSMVPVASTMYALYDTSDMLYKCIPSLTQPAEIEEQLAEIPVLGKIYSFTAQGINEVYNSWRVFIIEAVLCILLCFLFLFLMRFLVDFVVWLVMILVFVLLAAGGGITFFLYYTRGQHSVFPVVGVEGYSTLFLVASVVLWIMAFLYLLLLIALSSKIRLVCAILKVSGRVLSSGPLMLLIPIVGAILFIALLIWSTAIGISLYTARDEGREISLVPLSDAIQFQNVSTTTVDGVTYYEVEADVFNTHFNVEYLFVGNVFGFLWSVGFVNAVCFTSIAFVAVFWYFSSLSDSEKAVPYGGVCKAVCWTLFYHMGTLALGSLLIAIIQLLRFILSYFAGKAKGIVAGGQVFKCMLCYLECFLACFERIISVINRNAYVMMCLTSRGFCLSACSAISIVLSNAVEIMFLFWFLQVVVFVGKLFVIGTCCVSAYFLLGVDALGSEVEMKVLPLILVGIMAYFMSTVFFTVYDSSSDALLICYCYDRKINSSRGFYYMPTELEHQIDGYSQKQKLRQFENNQAEAHAH